MSFRSAGSSGRRFDVAIVGSGPAGLAAAEVVRRYELDTVIIDEQPRAGGQILRQPPDTFDVEDWMTAAMYREPRAVLQSMAEDSTVRWLFGTTVHGIDRYPRGSLAATSGRFELCVQSEQGLDVIEAGVVVLAPGCYERPLAVPGWILPGVMGAGAIQAFVKSQQFVPGKRFLLAGCHPLQLVVADQLVEGGAKVAAVVFTQRFRDAAGLFRNPLAVLQNTRQLTETARMLVRLRRAGVPLRFGRSIVGIEGEDRVEGATIAPLSPDGRLAGGVTESIPCDRVGLCHGFSASSELARQAGADVRYRPHDGGWQVRHDRWFQASIDGLFAAGEITGLAGAEASLYKGRIAALGVLQRAALIDRREADRLARHPRRRLRRHERFAGALNRVSRPPAHLSRSVTTDETVVCRCESVTLGELRRTLAEHTHIRSANALKLTTRVGMGMCQGRFCADRVTQLVAEARGLSMDEIGTFRAQFPVKPLNLGLLRCPIRRISPRTWAG